MLSAGRTAAEQGTQLTTQQHVESIFLNFSLGLFPRVALISGPRQGVPCVGGLGDTAGLMVPGKEPQGLEAGMQEVAEGDGVALLSKAERKVHTASPPGGVLAVLTFSMTVYSGGKRRAQGLSHGCLYAEEPKEMLCMKKGTEC